MLAPGIARYPQPMHPHDEPRWDRPAELEAIQRTYDGYEADHRARLWDRRRPGYGRLVATLQERLRESLVASVPRSDGVVLDLGCGDGDLTDERARLPGGTDWIGLDLREDAVNRARARFPDTRFIVASADAVPLADASVDVVVARVLFSSLPSMRLEDAVAREIGRLLRPGGWLVWLDVRYRNPANPAIHGLSERHIARLFPGWHRELRLVGLLPPIARRLGPITPVAFPALAAVPALRSHLVGRLRPASRTAA